nr:GntR family transcriptional regulator [Aquibacillus sediminis]
MKDKIMRGDFVEKNYTSQSQLVEELNMSRTPIVVALRRLANEGFVRVASKQGIIIQELSIKETNELFDMRIALETYSIKRINHLPTDDDFQKLEQLIEEQKQSFEKENFYNFSRADADFHKYLLEIGGNSAFINTMQNIWDRLFFHSTLVLRKTNDIPKFIEEHVAILENLKKGDYNSLSKVLESHIQGGKMQFLEKY